MDGLELIHGHCNAGPHTDAMISASHANQSNHCSAKDKEDTMSQENLDRELLNAARIGDTQKINTLLTKRWLSKCSRVDATDDKGWTALML